MPSRGDIIKRVRKTGHFPVVIVGGGINGIGTFRDLSAQGIDCLLVEKGDFCAGASGASSRMIHGGLKYLESGELRLVAESVSERNLLLRNAAHAVAPAEFLILNRSWFGGTLHAMKRFFGGKAPLGGRGTFITAVGLFAYDMLGMRNKATPRSSIYSRAAILRKIKGLRDNLVAASSYYDCLIEQPERLAVELVLDGLSDNPGSAALNHVSLIGLSDGRLRLRDEIEGAEWDVTTSLMINAGGAWIDEVNRRAGQTGRLISGTKGSHIVLDHPELAARLGDAVLCFEAADGRECFAYVVFERVVVGSSDIPVIDPDAVRCSPEETRYLFAALEHAFPGFTVKPEQIVYTYCGVRPLAHAPVEDPAELSRSHALVTSEAAGGRTFPILSLIGGKWTTYRSFSEEAADRALKLLGAKRSKSTRTLAIGGGKDFDIRNRERSAGEIRGIMQCSGERADTLVRRYGSRAAEVARHCLAHGDTPLSTDRSYSIPEIDFLVNREFARRICDILKRRTSLALRGLHTGEVIDEIAAIMGNALHWDEATMKREADLARDELARFNLPELDGPLSKAGERCLPT